jgi:hypothetical protein
MFRALCLTRLLMAMTLAVMATLLASAGAQAHPGHDHGAGPAVTSVVYAQVQAGKAVEAVPSVRQSNIQAEASMLPATRNTARLAFNTCLNGCCQPGGAGCLTVWVVSDPELPTPALLPVAVNLTVVERAGVKPDALPEPPNSLA